MRRFNSCVCNLSVSFFQEWKRDLKFVAIAMLQIYWMWVTIVPLRDFMKLARTRVTWGIVPVFFSDAHNILIIFIGLILLFSDVPFYKEISLYQIARSGKKEYIKARLVYIVVATFLYLVSWVIVLIVFITPYFTPSSSWGKIITTLVYTLPSDGRQLFINPSFQHLVERYSVAEALGLSLLLSLLTMLIVAFSMYLASILIKRRSIAPIFIGGALAFAPDFIDTLGLVQELRFLPTAWGRLGVMYKTGSFMDPINLLWRNLVVGHLIMLVLVFAVLLLANKKDKRMLKGYWL